MDNAVLWYRKKIGAYDLQIWEKAVELQEKKFEGIKDDLKREARLKSDLIDVDLVRGSTFSKNKPQLNVVELFWMGFLRMLFLPIFYKWWIQQANALVFAGALVLYFAQMLCLFLYATLPGKELKCVYASEVVLPSIFMLTLVVIHCQVVSTYFITSYSNSSDIAPRTLSKALLQPAEGDDCQRTLSFVTSSVRNIDSQAKKQKSQATNKSNNQENLREEDVLLNSVQEDMCSSCGESSEGEHTENNNKSNLSTTALLPGNMTSSDRISIRIWEGGQWKKCNASLIHIGGTIIKKVDLMCGYPDEYHRVSIVLSLAIAFLPSIYRFAQHCNVPKNWRVRDLHVHILAAVVGLQNLTSTFIMTNALVQRMILSCVFFVMLRAAQQTFRKRFLYAKYFTHLTSGRRAKKSLIPHFRLNKVNHIRVWLALRSYLRRRGPQRSIDVIVSSCFLCSVCLLCFVTVHLLNSSEAFVASVVYWDCLLFLFALGLFILHFITVGVKINKKYNSISTLLTEQINLHLQMERKPLKKEKLQRANNVLTLAAKLIKEIEEPFNIYGLTMNPILYNITRVILLSAFSGVVSEMLGFKLKIWKIKT